MLNNTPNTSAKRYAETALEAGINYTEALTEGTEEIIAYHRVLMSAVRENRIPGDIKMMEETEQMLITMNRLMYEEHSKIMHQKMMQAAEKKAMEMIQEHKEAAAAEAAARRAQNTNVKPSNE